jgi:hypothetical protein
MKASKDHTTSEVLDAMRMGTDYTFVIQCRGLGIPVRVLSIKESVQIDAEVVAELLKIKDENQRTARKEATLYAMKTLVRAARESSTTKVEPPISEYMLQEFSADELKHLYDQYLEGCELLNPSIEDLTEARMVELVNEIKKNPSTQTGLSKRHLAQLISFCCVQMPQQDKPAGG